ncbi:hypothetical protein BZA70DRAFT_266929 [Myxozyma melibiosi]|uniref:NAD(P)-binding protein n=1 Tax=Myxozyma melibiosi TaxID=54550 RepID=A0ABR1F7S4_9ASCO
MSYGFTFDDIKDLSGKVAIVTGGNSGLGEVIARELARKHAKVYIAARSPARAEQAIARIKAALSDVDGLDDNLLFLELDLETMKGSVAAAKFFMKLESRLDILVANAGLGATKSELTPDGYERNFGVNHLGHFAFITTLLPLIEKTATEHPESDIRIVLQSSTIHYRATKIDYSDVTKTYKSSWSALTLQEMMGRYARSKLANVYLSRELSERLKDYKNIYVNACHPGLVYTHIFDLSTSPLPSWMQYIGSRHAWLCGVPLDDGVKTALFLATDKRVVTENIKKVFMYPGPQTPLAGFFYCSSVFPKPLNSIGSDDEEARKLWEFSEQALAKATAS